MQGEHRLPLALETSAQGLCRRPGHAREGFSGGKQIIPSAAVSLSQLQGLQAVGRALWQEAQVKHLAESTACSAQVASNPMVRRALNYPSWELVNVKGIGITSVQPYKTACNTAAVPKPTRGCGCLERMEPRT